MSPDLLLLQAEKKDIIKPYRKSQTGLSHV